MSGLLGGFDNVMAGLSAEDVERAAASATPAAGQPAVRDDQLGATASQPADSFGAQSVRAIDPRAMALAQRMLGVVATAPSPAGRDVSGFEGERWASMRFVPITGGAPVELHRASPATLTIGRAEGGATFPDLQLIIDRAVVSRRHCQVVATPEGFGVIDLGAANATAVLRGGVLHPVGDSPFQLQPGDIISTVSGECPMVHVEPVNVEPVNVEPVNVEDGKS